MEFLCHINHFHDVTCSSFMRHFPLTIQLKPWKFLYNPVLPEGWQSGLMHRSWKPAMWKHPWVRIPPLPPKRPNSPIFPIYPHRCVRCDCSIRQEITSVSLCTAIWKKFATWVTWTTHPSGLRMKRRISQEGKSAANRSESVCRAR